MPVKARHFDVADDEAAPITFDYRGVTYRCRGSAPALPILRGMRAQMSDGLDEATMQRVGVEFLEAIFEDGELDRILKTGITIEKLMQIAERVMALYSGEDAAGEAEPPTTGDASSATSSSTST